MSVDATSATALSKTPINRMEDEHGSPNLADKSWVELDSPLWRLDDPEDASILSQSSGIDDVSTSSQDFWQPEPGSLCAAMRCHNRECLYVRAIAWRANLHLPILGIQFEARTSKREIPAQRKLDPGKCAETLEALAIQEPAKIGCVNDWTMSLMQAMKHLQAGHESLQESAMLQIFDLFDMDRAR
jgi:hypothetical protein